MSKKDNSMLYIALGIGAIYLLSRKTTVAAPVNPIVVNPGASNLVTSNTNPVTSIANSLSNIFKGLNNSPATTTSNSTVQPVISTSQQQANSDAVNQEVSDIFSPSQSLSQTGLNSSGNLVSLWSPNVTNAYSSGDLSNLSINDQMALDEMA